MANHNYWAHDPGPYHPTPEERRQLAHRLNYEYLRVFELHSLKGVIRVATLVLFRSAKYLGRWDRSRIEIELNERLCYEYDWGVVREVLKHEIAHQLVDDYYGGVLEGEQDHGATFQKACQRIGVAPWARTARVDLDDPSRPATADLLGQGESPVEKKIAKLLKLSESDNVHEARLALQRVQELRRKHLAEWSATAGGDVPGSTGDEDDHGRFHVLTFPTGRNTRDIFHVTISGIFSQYFGVQCIFTKTYDARALKEQNALEVLGVPRDLLMVEYIYHYLRRTCDRLWEVHRKKPEQLNDPHFSARSHRTSFYRGVLEGFSEALRQKAEEEKNRKAPSKAHKEETALVEATSRALQKSLSGFYKHRYPRVKSGAFRTTANRKGALDAGKKLGKNLKVRDPIASSGSGARGPRMITGGRGNS